MERRALKNCYSHIHFFPATKYGGKSNRNYLFFYCCVMLRVLHCLYGYPTEDELPNGSSRPSVPWRYHFETNCQRPSRDIEVRCNDVDCAASVCGNATIRLRPNSRTCNNDSHQARHCHHR